MALGNLTGRSSGGQQQQFAGATRFLSSWISCSQQSQALSENQTAAALDRTQPDALTTFLHEACGGDSGLKDRVERLLKAHEDTGSFLDRTPEELDATAVSDEAVSIGDRWRDALLPSDDPHSNGRLGESEVREMIGRGGFGVVLRAFELKLNRTVAIKMLAPELATSPMAVRRFLREAQAAAAVCHDHIVTVHAVDEDMNPPVIVMKYLDGQSLQQKIDNQGALDLKSILRIGMECRDRRIALGVADGERPTDPCDCRGTGRIAIRFRSIWKNTRFRQPAPRIVRRTAFAGETKRCKNGRITGVHARPSFRKQRRCSRSDQGMDFPARQSPGGHPFPRFRVKTAHEARVLRITVPDDSSCTEPRCNGSKSRAGEASRQRIFSGLTIH